MGIDYKKELEGAAKTMILVHNPDTLIKIIVRMMVQKVRVKHAGILLHSKEKNTYILTVSRGPAGIKVPAGFARMDMDNPLINFFTARKDKQLFNDGVVIYEQVKKLLRKKTGSNLKNLLNGVLHQMEIFDAAACVPSYFRNELLGILLLSVKTNNRKFSRNELNFFNAIASDVAMAIRNAQLFRELEEEISTKHRLFINTAIALAAAIDAKDRYTHDHISRVTSLSLAIANKISEINKRPLSKKFMEDLQIASLLHDIGKIGVPEAILNKAGPLTEVERKKINEHPLMGVNILQSINELRNSILGVKCHHERYDGTGYPEGLKGEQIPLIASIISVADTFDAMTSDRPYRKAFSKEAAIREIRDQAGKQFAPLVSSAICDLFRENKI